MDVWMDSDVVVVVGVVVVVVVLVVDWMNPVVVAIASGMTHHNLDGNVPMHHPMTMRLHRRIPYMTTTNVEELLMRMWQQEMVLAAGT